MSTDPKPTLSDLFPLPEGVKLRTHKFGANPVSALFTVPVKGDRVDSANPRPEFQMAWEDKQQGLKVLVREQDNGRLIADVSSTDAGMLNKAAVSVGLMGTGGDRLIRKTIPLATPEANGCSGSADFGLLAEAVKELGLQLGVVVFLLV